MKKIILASKSPRRKELLDNLNIEYDIIVHETDEAVDSSLSYEDNIKNIAYKKALVVAETIKYDALVIAADTMVIKDKLIGKPVNREDATKTLKLLSGDIHHVMTGVCIIDVKSNKSLCRHKVTKVKFRELTDEMISNYIDSGEVWDKAGAYGIQGLGSILVEGIEGCYFNVKGLPVSLLGEMLMEFGIKLL